VRDGYDETWVIEEIPLGEISPPPRRVRKYLRGINREALTVGNRGEMMLVPLMGRVSRRSVCQLMFDWQCYSNGQDIQSGIDVDPFTLLPTFVLSLGLWIMLTYYTVSARDCSSPLPEQEISQRMG
jgi:hypothetical protein